VPATFTLETIAKFGFFSGGRRAARFALRGFGKEHEPWPEHVVRKFNCWVSPPVSAGRISCR
jgi:hypothetical protein